MSAFSTVLPAEPHLSDVFTTYREGVLPLLELHDAILRRHTNSGLSVADRELIATYVAKLNSSNFLSDAHTTIAGMFGVRKELLDKLVHNDLFTEGREKILHEDPLDKLTDSEIDPKLKLLLKFVRELTLNPGSPRMHAVRESVHSRGVTDAMIHDAIMVTSCFSAMSRICEGHGVASTPSGRDATTSRHEKDIVKDEIDRHAYVGFGKKIGVVSNDYVPLDHEQASGSNPAVLQPVYCSLNTKTSAEHDNALLRSLLVSESFAKRETMSRSDVVVAEMDARLNLIAAFGHGSSGSNVNNNAGKIAQDNAVLRTMYLLESTVLKREIKERADVEREELEARVDLALNTTTTTSATATTAVKSRALVPAPPAAGAAGSGTSPRGRYQSRVGGGNSPGSGADSDAEHEQILNEIFRVEGRTAEDLHKLFDELDVNHSGRISKEEFQKWFTNPDRVECFGLPVSDRDFERQWSKIAGYRNNGTLGFKKFAVFMIRHKLM